MNYLSHLKLLYPLLLLFNHLTTGFGLPCISYLDSSSLLCQECDDGYALLLFNQTSTICAVVSTSDSTCAIDSNYAYEQQYQQTNLITYTYYGGMNVTKPYCFNCTDYYKRDDNQLCSVCTQQDISSSLYLNSVYNNSQGCADCSVSGYSHESVSYITQADLYMRECSSSASYSCTFTQYYDTSSKQCKECTEKYTNCAACNSSTCTLCPFGFFLHPSVYDYSTGSYKTKCIFGVCPKGQCKNSYTNLCETSLINNCEVCSVNSTGGQVCDICSSGYQANITDYNNSCAELSSTVGLNLFVNGNAPILSAEYGYNFTNNGSSPTFGFLFIQEALNYIDTYQQSNFISKIKASLYLSKYDHFFFQCDGDEYDSTQFSSLVQYCQNATLQKQYFINDNIQLTIKPMYCSLESTLEMSTDSNYATYCVASGTKPIIYINHAHAYFNISGIASFENLIFSGINAMVVPTNSSMDFSVFPLKLCYVKSEPTGADKSFGIASVSNTNTTLFSYSCKDSWYSGPSTIDVTDTSRRCTLNNFQKFYPYQESTLKCPGDPNDDTFFYQNTNGVYSKRRFTLFNMYAFPSFMSTYKSYPSINITSCDFTYFLGGYESLISIENHNLQKTTFSYNITTANDGITTFTNEQYSFYGQEKGTKIAIFSSTFKHSRFCKGMITFRKQYYITQQLSFTNYTHLFSYTPAVSDTSSYIIISKSTFTNLNAFTNVTALAISGIQTPKKYLNNSNMLEPLSYSVFIHKGIVLNLEDFGGNIEIAESTFQKNFHFIPEAFVQKYYVSNQTSNSDQFTDSYETLEYKLGICDTEESKDSLFLESGLSIDDDYNDYFDTFERLGLIYISRNMGSVMIRQSTFRRNIGTFGGAITINSPNWETGNQPFVIVANSTFEYNVGYFSGNAIFIRNTKLYANQYEVCAGVYIENSIFQYNIGTKKHNGGAISALCQYIDKSNHDDYKSTSSIKSLWTALDLLYDVQTMISSMIDDSYFYNVYFFKFNIEKSSFTENYSGQKGTAVYLKYISKIRIYSCTFKQNGPVYALTEYQISPYATVLTNRVITYVDPTETCFDEFNYINTCASSDYNIDWPQVKGALYVEHCTETFCLNESDLQYLNIISSTFQNNDAGPILDMSQPSEDNAASLYIKGGLYNTITRSKFIDHLGNYDYYTSVRAPTVGKYFPTFYFQYSQSPVIRIKVNPSTVEDATNLQFQTTMTSCTFQNNKAIQILGLLYTKQFYGSLISYETTYQYGLNFIPILNIQSSTIRDNKFLGNETALIYLYKGILNFTDNTAIGNGYYTEDTSSKSKVTSSSSYFPFEGYTQYLHQAYGVVYLSGPEKFPTKYFHQILRNTFSFLFAYQGGAAALRTDYQNALFQNNDYKYCYSYKGSSIYGRNSDGRSTIKMINETVNFQFSADEGAFTFEPHLQDFLSVVIKDSTFQNCYSSGGSAIFTDSLAVGIVQNCSFKDTFFQKNKTAYIITQLKGSQWTIYDFITFSYLYSMSDKISRSNGQIYMEQGYNTGAVYFDTELIRAATHSFLTYSYIVDCKFENVTAKSGSAIMCGKEEYMVIMNTGNSSQLFSNCTQTQYGVVRVQSKSYVYGYNLNFYRSYASTRGSVISISESSVTLENCTFQRNNAAEKATIYVFTDSSFTCNYCYFYNNYAKEASGIFAINNEKGTIVLNNSMFINNTQEENLINMVYTDAFFYNTVFIDNTASLVNHGITSITSDIVAQNITINYTNKKFLNSNNYSVDSGFFNLNFQSTMAIYQSNIQNTRGAIAALLYATGSSSVTIDKNTVIKGCSSITGKALYFSMTNSVKIANTKFEDNSQIDVFIDNANITITDCIFTSGSQQFIYASSASVFITNCKFKDSQNQDIQGKALYCDCQNLLITNSEFYNLSALEGGSLYLTSNSKNSYFRLYNNSFMNNTAMQGGAIAVPDAAKLEFVSNLFLGNQANVISPSTSSSWKLNQKGYGGAISLDCFNEKASLNNNCNVTFSKGNKFISNSASDDGGAIIWVGNIYNDDNTTQFINNSANYADDVASYPKSLQIQFTDNNDEFDRIQNRFITNVRRLQQTSSNVTQFPHIVSGTAFQFVGVILDQNDIVYSTDNSSVATLKTSNNVIMQHFEVTAKNGVYNFSEVIITMEPGTYATVSLTITGISTFGNTVNFVANPLKLEITARNCVQGEEYTVDKKCSSCDKGYYLLQKPSNVTACKLCPIEAKCFGKDKIAPKDGYWRVSNVSEDFIQCENQQACLAGDTDNPTGICAPGYRGIICGDCQMGYKKSGQFQCSQCPNPTVNSIQIIALFAGLIVIVVFMVRSTLNSADKAKPVYSVYLKIIANHFQILGVISNIDYKWPTELENIQSGSSQLSGIGEQVFSFDCFFMQSGLFDNHASMFYAKIIFFMILPVLMTFGAIIFWIIYGLIKRNFGKLKDQIISTIVVLLFLVQPNIAKVLFQSFNCMDIAGENRLRADVEIICYKGQHLVYALSICLPGVIVWVFGIPLFTLILLIKHRKQILSIQNMSVLNKCDQADIREVRMKYGFIFNGYNISRFYWEIIIMYRKVFMVMGTVFLSVVSSDSQVLICLFIITTSLILQVNYEPFYTDTLNRMEMYSLQVCALTMYAGMFYVTGSHYNYMNVDGLKWFFMILVIAPNAIFLTYWVNQMRIEFFKILFQRSKKLFRLLTCGMINMDKFEKKNFATTEGTQQDLKHSDNFNSFSDTYKTYYNKPDDFSNVITKNYMRQQSIKYSSSSDSDFRISSKFDKNSLRLRNSEDNKSNDGKVVDVSEINLDFPKHMIRRLPLPDEYMLSTERKDLITNTSQSNINTQRELSSRRKVHPENILTSRIANSNSYISKDLFISPDKSKFLTIHSNGSVSDKQEIVRHNSEINRKSSMNDLSIVQRDDNISRLSKLYLEDSYMDLNKGNDDQEMNKSLNFQDLVQSLKKQQPAFEDTKSNKDQEDVKLQDITMDFEKSSKHIKTKKQLKQSSEDHKQEGTGFDITMHSKRRQNRLSRYF